MRFYALAVYIFLYGPIALVALFSFNSGRAAGEFLGFSVKWYAKVAHNVVALDALVTSLTVAGAAATAATLVGSPPAPGLGGGDGSIIAAHSLFNMALVIVIVRARITGMDRTLIEASADLYATPRGPLRLRPL